MLLALLAGTGAPCVIISTGMDPACLAHAFLFLSFLFWVFALITSGEKVGVDKKIR